MVVQPLFHISTPLSSLPGVTILITILISLRQPVLVVIKALSDHISVGIYSMSVQLLPSQVSVTDWITSSGHCLRRT